MIHPPMVIYCDFDGTVTQDDVIDTLLIELADPSWRFVETEWEEGLIGSRECLARQIPLIRGGWKAIEKQLDAIALDPTFGDFARWCMAHHVPLRIVSDGIDRVIEVLLARANIQVDAIYANHLVESPAGELSLAFPYPSTQRGCNAGLCKCERMEDIADTPLRVVIGDGRSDVCWAHRADWLFAKSRLLTHCRAEGIACIPFENFNTVRLAIMRRLNRRHGLHRTTAPLCVSTNVR